MNVNDITAKVVFESRIDMEVLLSMIVLNDWNRFGGHVDLDRDNYEEDYLKLISEMQCSISKYMCQEMESFFSDLEVSRALVGFLFKEGYAGSFLGVLKKIEALDEAVMLSYIVESFLYSNLTNEKQSLDIHKNRKDICFLLSAVRDAEVSNKELKERIIDLLTNHAETKARFLLMLKSFYENVFMPVEEIVLASLTVSADKYKKYLETEPEEFVENFFKIKPDFILRDINIHISYFMDIAVFGSEAGGWEKALYVIGVNADKHLELVNQMRKDNVQKLFKLLSDKIRLDIIEALGERPWYNQELAKKVKVTPSTIFHHIGLMVELDLIHTERHDHRVYFILKKDRLRELMLLSTNIILGE
ncbi:MAG: winged helix-turn-helix domain-containing protein [Bacillota bacterium]|nr:winged helix-turn-helix domain-containing protein [Bacillota bacterium]